MNMLYLHPFHIPSLPHFCAPQLLQLITFSCILHIYKSIHVCVAYTIVSTVVLPLSACV